MKTYTFPERHPSIPGPWENEPDKAQWIDPATDLDCLAVRNHMGNWCGYAGVLPGHLWHGKQYDEVDPHPEVHGGLTYSDFCMEGAEDGPGVCHVPAPGRPAKVWWLGFDCGHHMDVIPRFIEQGYPELALGSYLPEYRTFEYVQEQCAHLASQIQAHGLK